MPYSNIVWIKLEIRMLNDYRFTDKLNDNQKLLYIGLLLLAGDTKNAIPNDLSFIKRRLNFNMDESEIQSNIGHLMGIFSKLIVSKELIQFKGFEENHNFIKGSTKEIQRKSKGNPKDVAEEEVEEEIEKEIKRHDFFKNEQFLKTFEDFKEMRKTLKKPLTSRAVDLQLKQLEKYPIETAIRMIEQSIKNSWTGIFELKGDKNGTSGSKYRNLGL